MKNENQRWTEKDDLKMMKNPTMWPAWPMLPLKRYKKEGGHPDLAVLYEAAPLKIFENVNLFDESTSWGPGRTVTAEEVVKEGWIVD